VQGVCVAEDEECGKAVVFCERFFLKTTDLLQFICPFSPRLKAFLKIENSDFPQHYCNSYDYQGYCCLKYFFV
jgi:hypothetical protein